MAWVKGDREWHYAERENLRVPPIMFRKVSESTCGLMLAYPPQPVPTDADPKCPVCQAAHP